MANINEAKLQSLMEHLSMGGSTDKASLASALSGTVRMKDATIESYLEEAEARDSDFAGIVIGGSTIWYDCEEVEEAEEAEEVEEEEPEPDPLVEPEPTPKSKGKPKKKHRFFLRSEGGHDTELERIDTGGGSIIVFQVKQPKDIVSLIIKKEVVEVDLVPLRKKDPSAMSDFGITNEKLLALAVAAR